MRVSPKKKGSAWFMSAHQCPVTGLAVTHPESVVSSGPGSDFHAEAAKIGDNFLLVKSYGYVTSTAESELLAFFDKYIQRHFDIKKGIIYIEDYEHISGGDSDSRKQYIAYFKRNDFLFATILFNLPPIYKISFNLFKKLNIYSSRANAVDSYEQAIALALRISNKNIGLIDESIPDKKERSLSSFLIKKLTLTAQLDLFIKKITGGGFFFKKNSRIRSIQQYSEDLLKYIESIDWQKPGVHPPPDGIYDTISSRKVFDAISFVKSEIDSLLEERTAAEFVLRESEKKYRLLVEHAKAGICEYDYIAQKITSANNALLDITGYSKDELLVMNLSDILTDKGKENFYERLSLHYSGKPVTPDFIYQIITKKGDVKWVLSNAHVTYFDNRPQKASIVLTDITVLKTIESQLMEYQHKLKKLSVQLSISEEEQRKSLASQLHDNISQELFVAQLQLESFEKSLNDDDQRAEISKIKKHVIQLIKETRSLIFDLSPPMLYDSGLSDALDTLARMTEAKFSLNVFTNFSDNSYHINDDIKFIIYRNIKELIHNIIKHGKAKNIFINVKNSQNSLKVIVKDDGVGFDPASHNNGTNTHVGFGLFDIREKISHLGGKINIDSAPGHGTSIYMEVPLEMALHPPPHLVDEIL
ncbi:MAG: PAS domain-containing sensor histidine kinase [Desulfobacterales bacterium]|jgi:PAS domain S-box-containing protein|nr:PAS domain-containing sensor histidine kinase [Desulfobacterales bacterium]